MSQRKRKPSDERARFERWLARYYFLPVAEIRVFQTDEDSYADAGYDIAWAAWCATGRKS